MKQVTYKFVFFPSVKDIGQYIGIAWNYEHALLISTRPCDTFSLAQLALKNKCMEMEVELRWFDGEYEYDSVSGSIIQAKLKQIYPEGVDK